MTVIFGAQGVQPTLRGQPSNVLTLSPGELYTIPAGTWNVLPGRYSGLQQLDPITGIWRGVGDVGHTTYLYINSDGNNYRLANLGGCVAAVDVTNAGSGYTTAPIITDNGGSATYQAIIGGALSTSVTVTNGGSSYVYAPTVFVSAPPPGGVQATATCTISAGAVNAVTVLNQGAGYTSPPTFTFINNINDTLGNGAAAVGLLTGSGTVTAVLVTNPGTAVSSVPTLTFSGGGGTGAAGTALMVFTTTAYTVTSAGSGYVGNVLVSGFGNRSATLSSYLNPAISTGLVRSRAAFYGAALSSTAVTTAGQTIYDGGIFSVVPTGYVSGFSNGSAALVSFTVGGVNDTSVILAV